MSREAFTLLEVVLSLALSVVVLVIVGMAIDVHLNSLAAGRTEVEEARLARALLHRIADDLRSTIVYDPVDVEALVPDAMPIPSADEMDEESGVREAEPLEPEEPEDSSVENLADSALPSTTPGLYGNQYELQVDVSRLPRLDQFQGSLGGDDGSVPGDQLSDVKTVVYYVADDTGSAVTTGTAQSATGLVRREMARATTLWAAEHGELLDVQNDLGPLAPEVAAIEFQYFDGSEWLLEWDTDAQGGLPMAVAIALGVTPQRRRNEQSASIGSPIESTLAENDDLLVYQLIVHLPAAQPIEETSTFSDEEGLEEDSTEDSGSDEPSGSSDAAGGGSSGDAAGGSSGGGGGSSGGGGGGAASGSGGQGGGR